MGELTIRAYRPGRQGHSRLLGCYSSRHLPSVFRGKFPIKPEQIQPGDVIDLYDGLDPYPIHSVSEGEIWVILDQSSPEFSPRPDSILESI